MNITFTCPHCARDVRLDVPEQCRRTGLPRRATSRSGCRPGRSRARGCLGAWFARASICSSARIFRSGWGWDWSCWGWWAARLAWGYGQPIVTFAILFATALLDVVLYMIVPNALMCYRCGAQYRQVVGLDQHGAFDLEVHERHRQAKHRGRPKRRGCRPKLTRHAGGSRPVRRSALAQRPPIASRTLGVLLVEFHGSRTRADQRRPARAGERRRALRRRLLAALRQRCQHLRDPPDGRGPAAVARRRGGGGALCGREQAADPSPRGRAPDWPANRWARASSSTSPATCGGSSTPTPTAFGCSPAWCMLD